MNTNTRTKTAIAGLLLAVTLPLALAACSSDERTDTSDTAAASGIGAKWGSCMRDAGYDVPDPSDDQVSSGAYSVPEGADTQGFQEAAGTCNEQVGVKGVSSAEKQEWARQYDQVASCIREEYPDYPEQQGGGISFSPEDYPRAAEDAFQELAEQCLQEYSPDSKTRSVG